MKKQRNQPSERELIKTTREEKESIERVRLAKANKEKEKRSQSENDNRDEDSPSSEERSLSRKSKMKQMIEEQIKERKEWVLATKNANRKGMKQKRKRNTGSNERNWNIEGKNSTKKDERRVMMANLKAFGTLE